MCYQLRERPKKKYTLRISKCLSAFEIVFWQELEGKSTYDMIEQSFDALA